MPLSSKGPPQISLMKSFIRNLFPKRKPKQLAGNDNDNDNGDGESISDLMKQVSETNCMYSVRVQVFVFMGSYL